MRNLFDNLPIERKPDVKTVSIRLRPEQVRRLEELCDYATKTRGQYTAQGKLIGALIDAYHTETFGKE
jgi:predicted DNA-binding protein